MSGEPKSKQDDPKQTPEDSLRRWVEKSGRALELRVARMFVKAGANDVVMSRQYQGDDMSSDMREIDVLASFSATSPNGSNHSIIVAVECKRSERKPWVGFLQDQSEPGGNRVERHFIGHRSATSRTENEWEEVWGTFLPFNLGHTASHMTDGHGSMEGSKGNEASSRAIKQARSAALGITNEISGRALYKPTELNQMLADGGFSEHNTSAFWVIAVAVTANKIYECKLDDAGEVHIAEREAMTVRVHVPGKGPRKVFVMQESAVEQFARDLREMMDRTEMVLRRPEA